MLILLLGLLCLSGKAQIPVSDQFHLEVAELRNHLVDAPLLSTRPSPVKILLPTPSGTQLTFRVWEDPILSEELQAKYPDYRTYALQGEVPDYTGRLLVSPAGLDAVVLGGEQVLFIESEDTATDLHRIYYWKLGSKYLSFDGAPKSPGDRPAQALKIAVLADDSYRRFHENDLAKAVMASVNGVNAVLQMDQGIQLQLQFFDTVDRLQLLKCRTEGFRGRAGESLKLFGDLVAEGRLALTDFDLGHLFSGRGFGSNTLAAVAGSDTYYDWNDDGTFDGPAKAGGGSGAVLPTGASWWGNLCKGIVRQLQSSDLALSLRRSASPQPATTDASETAVAGNPESSPASRIYYAGLRTMAEATFPHLSCLPYDVHRAVPERRLSLPSLLKKRTTRLQTSLTGGALLPLLVTRTDSTLVSDWLVHWRF